MSIDTKLEINMDSVKGQREQFVWNPEKLLAERERLREICSMLRETMREALELLDKGAPGWGVAKDLMRYALHRSGEPKGSSE